MKNIFFLFFLLIFTIANGQDKKFIFSQDGMTDYVIVELDSIKKETIYTKTVNWVKENYKNPDVVIKTTIENEKVRLEGFDDRGANGYGYTIVISIKDYKYKFEVSDIYYLPKGYPKSVIDDAYIGKFYKNGVLANRAVKMITNLDTLFNGLNDSLKKYIITKKKDDW